MSGATATLQIKAVMDTGDVIGNINQIQGALKNLKMPKDLTAKTEAKFEELNSLVKEYQTLLDKPHKSNADLRQLDQLGAKIKKVQGDIEKSIRHMDLSGLNFDNIHTEKIDQLRAKLKQAEEAVENFGKRKLTASGLLGDTGKVQGELAKVVAAVGKASEKSKSRGLLSQITESIDTGNITKTISLMERLQKIVNSGAGRENPIGWAKEAQGPLQNVLQVLNKIDSESAQAGSGLGAAKAEVSKLTSELREAVNIRIEELGAEAHKIADGMSEAASATNTFHNSMSSAMHQQSEMASQVQNLQNQVRNYFGLDEIFRKIGQLARDAMDTVKELDAAMTETAVVTNFDVSDMWEMLPTYTKNANQLGSTIADVYNAATLYYQQGLTTTQSMALANETLKMARIGGIEAAEATDMMTAALRGFNMEINEASAQRINDVYSKLAAITAADTKEIGTAMERTASIASSANMDFETTSAFLAQMIETTREAPENLGTAMKTIVARFQEMKVDPNTLVDSEGERLDFNRVDKALKAVGISLVDQNNEFRKNDDVFLDIASHWDGMTQAQQRYIATIAAGSRQQSRFIAMMQDYDRTLELVDAAYTAEGAGQAQFEKTLESMDSKLNRLKNAWDQFAMGFMNADFLKVGVDLGTKFLDIFEKVITGISKIGLINPFQNIIKSALTATAVFGGLLAMSKLLMAGVGKFAGMVLGEEAAKMSGVVGAANRKYAGPNKQQVEQAKATGKQASLAYQQAYYSTLQKNNQATKRYQTVNGWQRDKTILQATKEKFANAKQAQQATRGKTIQAGQIQSFNKEVALQFYKASKQAGLDQAGQKAANEFITGMMRAVKKGEKTVTQATKEVAARAAKGFNGVKINVPGITQQFTNTSNALNNVGTSARNAGMGIQSFAITLYGTPLQPFGMALNLVGSSLMGLGQIFTGVGNAIKTFQGAVILANAATAAGTGITVADAAAKLAAATGTSIYAAAEELAAAAGNEAAIAILAEKLALDQNTVSTLANAAAKAKQASASGKLKGAMNLISGAVGKLPGQFKIAAVAALVLTAAIIAIHHAATKSERDLKRQGDAAAQASQDLDTTKQALEAVNNDLEELASNDETLDGLVKGTTEWNNELAKANAHIIEMMSNYKTLSETYKSGPNEGEYKYIETDEDGRMSIKQSGQDAIKKEYQNAVNLATAVNAVEGALYNNLKDLNSKEYKKNQEIISGSYGYQAHGKTFMGTGINTSDEKRRKAVAQNENIRQMNDAREENAWKTGIHAAIADSGLGDTSAIENILTDQRDKLVDAVELGTKKENKEAYAEARGYEYVKKDTYKDAQGNELEIKYDTVKEMLPEIEAMQNAQEKAVSIKDSLEDAQQVYEKTVKAGIKNGTEGYDRLKDVEGYNTVISDILSSNAEANLDAVESFLHSTEDSTTTGMDAFVQAFEKRSDENDKILSDLTGIEISDDSTYKEALTQLKTTLQDNAMALIEQQTDAISGVAGVLQSADWGKTKGESNAEQEENIKTLIENMTSAQRENFNKITEGMADNLSAETAENYGTTIANLINQGEGDKADTLQKVFNKVDFSSAISTLEGFNTIANKNDKTINKIGKDWLKTEEAANTAATALQDVYTSDDFGELAEDMESYIKEQGRLDATKIMEMADSSQSLKRYLDATGASAEGVAIAFTHLSKNNFTLSNLTAGVVAAANAMEKLSANAAAADKGIQKLEGTNDSGRFEESLEGTAERLKDYIDNGEYGNEDLEGVLTQTFGIEKWTEAYGKGNEGIKSLYNDFVKLQDIEPSKIQKMLDDLPEGKRNVDELTKQIQKSEKEGGLGVVDSDIAGMIIQSATNKDINLKKDLEKTNKKDMQSAYLQATGIGTTNEKGELELQTGQVGSRGDIIAQAQLYSDNLEKQKTYLADLAKTLNPEGGEETAKAIQGAKSLNEASKILANGSEYISNFTTDTDAEKVVGSIQKDYSAQTKGKKGYEKEWWRQVGKQEDGSIDMQAINNELINSGYDAAKSMEATRLLAEEQIKKGETFKVGDQEFTKEDVADPNTFAQKWQEAIDNAQWSTVGQTIGNEIVAAMERANLEKAINESGVSDKAAYGPGDTFGANNISDSNLDKIHTAASESTSNPVLIAESVGTYLAGHQKEFASLDSNQQQDAINGLITKMNEWNFSPEQIVQAINTGLGTNLTTDNVTGEEGAYGLVLNKEDLEGQLSGLKAEVTAEITELTFNGTALASGQNNPNSVFNRYGTMARGSKSGYTIPGRPTLTGEEGEELIWEPKRNEAYMVGSNGPQFANITKDAVVWNAEQTKRIKKNSGTVGNFGTGARGIKHFGTMGGGAHGGGAGSGIGKGAGGSGGAGGGTIPGTFQVNVIANVTQVTPEIVSVPAKIVVSGTEGTPFGTPGANEGVIQETINVTGKINQTIPPEVPPEVPVKAKIEVGDGKGRGLLGAIKSLITGNNENTIKVKAVADKVTVSDKGQTVKVKAEASEVSVSEKGKTIDITAKATSITPPENNTIDVTAKATSITPPEDNTISVTGELKSVTNKSKKTVKGVKAVATVNKVKKGKNVAGEPVKVKGTAVVSKADTSGAEGDVQGLADTASSAQTMTVNANTTQAYNAVGALLAFIRNSHPSIHVSASPSSITVPVTPDFRGNWHKTLYIDKKAEGQNYQKYNSYAGGHGLVGPKGKGGLTLTGEEGYEVIWLPKQNEAMIVGLQGPQMINLPADAVVWPYKQSKKILANNQGAPVGSKADGTIHAGSLKKGRKAKPGEKRGVTKTIGAESRFFALIGNIEGAQASIERWSKKIDEAADKMDRYSKSVLHLSELNDSIAIQSKLIGKTYTEAAVTINNALKAIRQIDKSRKLVKISYTESAKPNAKERKVSAKEGQLVKRNAETGELEINESWIRKKAKQKVKVKGKKKKRKKNAYQVNQIIEQLRSEASSLVDTYNGNLNDAQDALNEAKQARIELVDSIKELYYTWANDLTEIQNLQNRMDLASSVTEIVTSAQSLLETQMKNSFGQLKGIFGNTIEQYADLMGQSIEASLGEIENQQELINLNKQNFKNNYDFQPLFDEITTQRQTLKEIEKSSGINSEEYSNQLAYVQSLEEEYAARAKAQEYITTTFNEYGSADVNFDTSKLEQDKKEGKITETVYNSIKEQYEAIIEDAKNLNSAISGLNGQVSSLLSQRTDAYSQMDSTAKTIAAGMEKGEEEQIDQLETINNTIKDTISKLIDSVKKELSRRREQDQNLETEADISKKMNRLAALRADTSGGNQLEIAQLEEDIRKSTKSYGETLEDQLLNKLQDANDEAYEQRERQISIMQTGFEYSKSIGEYILAAENLLLTMTDPNATSEAREKAINEAKKYFMLGTNGGEILTQWGEALAEGEWENANAQVANFAETIKKLNDAITIVTLQITKAEDRKSVVQQMQQNNTSAQDAYSILRSAGVDEESAKKLINDTYGEEAASKINTSVNTASVGKATSQPTSINVPEIGDATLDPAEQYQNFIDQFNNKENAEKKMSLLRAGFKNYMEYGKKELKKTPKELVKQLADTDLLSWTDVLEEYKNYRGKGNEQKAGKTVKSWYPKSKPGSSFRKAFAAVFGKWKEFKTGGLADFTGPAWLDGTPSKPELVLNSQDTKNFMTLKDVLGKSISSIGSASNVNENNNFNISINVDQIANDYDVDRMVARVKKEITKSASYRNVSQVRNFR